MQDNSTQMWVKLIDERFLDTAGKNNRLNITFGKIKLSFSF